MKLIIVTLFFIAYVATSHFTSDKVGFSEPLVKNNINGDYYQGTFNNFINQVDQTDTRLFKYIIMSLQFNIMPL